MIPLPRCNLPLIFGVLALTIAPFLALPSLAADPLLRFELGDPNDASRDELMALPGIGEAFANRIIEGRPYKTVDDLLNVSGIGPKTLDKLRPFLFLDLKKRS